MISIGFNGDRNSRLVATDVNCQLRGALAVTPHTKSSILYRDTLLDREIRFETFPGIVKA
ncbi:hypothetical protein BUE80_DR007244 [Diplocarpon rosae]|nr:hypothetical protein BUE80_DR007244 [Diplocarpon rosae]